MPYGEDGETWINNPTKYEEGMAENQAGHKPFAAYNLPNWVKHPLTHPFSGIFVGPDVYGYNNYHGTFDGIGNSHNYSTAHIAAQFGDIEMLEHCTEEELTRQSTTGWTAAHYAADIGTSWCIQWLVEHGIDMDVQDYWGKTPEDIMYTSKMIHTAEIEWTVQALKGELNEKNSVKAQEYKLKRWRPDALDKICETILDKNMLKQRKFMFKIGNFEMPYDLPDEDERGARCDLPDSLIKTIPGKQKPAIPAALLFPGQGSQYIGMMKDCVDLPAVKLMLEQAQKILGWDVKDLCLNGPEERLGETKYCQPVMFIAGMAGLEVMKQTKAEVVERPQATAGLSLGEYTAICAAGVLDFEDCLRLVKLRAEAMQRATQLVPQCMCSVAGLDRPTLERLCKEAREEDTVTPEPVCQIANALFPAGFTCAGTVATVEKLCVLAQKARALQARIIKAGGAFHTPLMKSAEEEVIRAIDQFAPKMQPPRCAIYFNITGKKVQAGTDPSEFTDLMKKQLTSEVQWEGSVKQMVMDHVKDFYEVGPLKQLKAMIKRIDQDAFKRTENIIV